MIMKKEALLQVGVHKVAQPVWLVVTMVTSKIGDSVTVHFGAVLSTSSATGYYSVSNLPFQANFTSGAAVGAGREYAHTNAIQTVYVSDNSTLAVVRKYDGTITANAYLQCSVTYRTD